jgi:hypothetical protein
MLGDGGRGIPAAFPMFGTGWPDFPMIGKTKGLSKRKQI